MRKKKNEREKKSWLKLSLLKEERVDGKKTEKVRDGRKKKMKIQKIRKRRGKKK